MKSNTLCVVVLLIFVSTCFCGEFDDDEEFVGTTKQQPTIKIQQIPELSPQTTNPIYQTQEVKPRSWILEITYVFLIGAYVINYFLGKRKNNAIAYSWAQSVVPFLKEQFSKVGEAKEGSTAVQVVPENAYSYRLQATGRVNCVGMQCSLTLRKRHDLMSLLFEYFTGSQDILSIDILFNEEVEDFVFAVLKTKDEKKMRKKFSDLSTFTRSEEHKDLSSKLCVCSEVEELSSEILSSEVCNALNSFEDQFISLRISDQSISADGYKHSLRMEIKLPSRADADLMSQNLLTLTKMAVYLIDVIPRIRLSKIAKQKTEKNRAKLAEFQQKQMHAQRQEAAQQKKLEKKQKELEQLDPQARARMEEKIAKKELKRKQKLRVVHV